MVGVGVALSVALGKLQVISLLFAAVTVGKVPVFEVTFEVELAVQPLLSVTVTVYVAAVVVVMIAVVRLVLHK